MFMWTRRAVLTAAAGLALAGSIAHAETQDEPRGAALLTIAGDIAHANRGTLDPRLDGVFKSHEIAFDRAFVFDRAMLEALPQETFEAQLPEGHEKATFTGPRLADVLERAGARQGASIEAVALDGYVAELAAADLTGKDWVVVLARNGRPFGIGGFGPAMLLEKPAAVSVGKDAVWPWAVFYIEVKK